MSSTLDWRAGELTFMAAAFAGAGEDCMNIGDEEAILPRAAEAFGVPLDADGFGVPRVVFGVARALVVPLVERNEPAAGLLGACELRLRWCEGDDILIIVSSLSEW